MAQELLDLWKELNVEYAEFEFQCGGDSMGDTTLTIYDNKDKPIENSVLSNLLENSVYQEVQFYENSDGYYIGESGSVHIRLSDEEDNLEYSKNSQAEYQESHFENHNVKLSKKELAYIKEKVANINGGEDGCITNFKKDNILSDEEEKLDILIHNKLINFCESESGNIENYAGWYSFSTNIDTNNPTEIFIDEVNSTILIQINFNVVEYRDSDY